MKDKICAPIIIPTLCRYEHFVRLMESLKRNPWAKYTPVYVNVDYPPAEKYMEGWKAIKDYLQNGDFSCFAEMKVFYQEKNLGSIVSVDFLREQVWKKFDRWIYTDDDIEFSSNFLEYINKCLDYYEDDEDVVAVSGYSYPIQWKVSEGATCLKQNINCSMWGTGFWKKKYDELSDKISKGDHFNQLDRVIKESLYKKMLDISQMEYINRACSPLRFMHTGYSTRCCDYVMRYCLSIYEKYVISPVVSKSRNYGFDGSGECCDMIQDASGNTALNYNYRNQPIDEKETFELVADQLQDHSANKDILNIFDARPDEMMVRTWRFIMLCERYGIFVARMYGWLTFIDDIFQRLKKR